jgi:hypothetical protein
MAMAIECRRRANDTVHSYTYDAEGNITKVDGGSTAQYVYDLFNRRIHVQTPRATVPPFYPRFTRTKMLKVSKVRK